jgi:hypothetical protein
MKTMEITKNLSQDSRSLGRGFNLGPPEHEAGVLTTQARRSLFRRYIVSSSSGLQAVLMGTVCFSETFASNSEDGDGLFLRNVGMYLQSTWRHNPEEKYRFLTLYIIKSELIMHRLFYI